MDRITQLIPEPCTAGFWSLQTITCNKVGDVYRPFLPSYGHRSHSRHLLSNKWGVSKGAEKSMEKLYIETSLCGEITALATIDGKPPSHPALHRPVHNSRLGSGPSHMAAIMPSAVLHDCSHCLPTDSFFFLNEIKGLKG